MAQPRYLTLSWAFAAAVIASVVASVNLAVCAPASSTAAGNESTSRSAPADDDARAVLSAERSTVWNPGMMGVGGIPTRSTVCHSVAPRGGKLDDTAQIQAAINA